MSYDGAGERFAAAAAVGEDERVIECHVGFQVGNSALEAAESSRRADCLVSHGLRYSVRLVLIVGMGECGAVAVEPCSRARRLGYRPQQGDSPPHQAPGRRDLSVDKVAEFVLFRLDGMPVAAEARGIECFDPGASKRLSNSGAVVGPAGGHISGFSGQQDRVDLRP
ncbi:hypothetical protein OH799_07165 [Nocardia sp. NBC_00881]|uniref:hypothetical protein n=1 Tax=Nocardia sp. NBC_00881 TaxID=2975995 RepID=UPI00386723C8|nr:hypothetical protein OH799_07165 [Nocardia sp. NBC_00881]